MPMTKDTFPYLTIPLLDQDGVAILSQAATWWPEYAVELNAAASLLPLIGKVQEARAFLQWVCDKINSITGAVATS